MSLFGRGKPLHRRLADEAGLSLDAVPAEPRGQSADVPGWDGEQRGEPGIHGVPRTRRWDTVATAEAPALRADEARFVALPDGTLLLDEDAPDEPEGSLGPLATAVEASLAPPYRAEAVRRGRETWAVAARRIAVVEQSGLDGDEAELVVRGGERSLTLDGARHTGRTSGFDRAGERLGHDYVVRAKRLDSDLWEVEATPL
jgi:hypothetical protein